MKRSACLRTALALLVVSLFAAAPPEKARAAEFTLKAVVTTRTAIQTEQLWTWAKEQIETRTNGRVKLEIVSLPELGLSGFELVRVMQAGLVDLGDVMPTYVAGDIAVVEGADLLGIFGDYDSAVKGHRAWEAVLRDKYSDRLGAVVLGSWPWAQQLLYSNKPVNSLSDLKGRKIRVFSPAMAQFVRALGAEPVSLAYAEVYTALERGTVDGAITCSRCGWDTKWYEVTKHLVDLHMGTAVSTLFVVSKRTWNKLPPDIRQTLEQVGSEFTERGWRLSREWAKDGIEKNTKQGGMTYVVVPKDREPILKLVREEVATAWAKRAGPQAKADWNAVLGPIVGFTIR
jgi:TRAP-type C4-dicarboxylate transport system substrate-binding protein